MRYKLVILLLFISLIASGTNYYVKTVGNDGAAGTSDGTAWATIAKVNSPGFTYQPDDTIFLSRGNTWKERLLPVGDGTSGHPIVFTAYGTGAKPILTGRDTISGWSRDANWTDSSDVYYISTSSMSLPSYTSINRLWLDGIEVRRTKTLAGINDMNIFYYCASLERLYLHIATNPGATYTRIETFHIRNNAVYLLTDNYFTFKNIDFQGGWMCVYISDSDHTTLDSCNIGKYTGGYGIWAAGSNSIDYTTIQDCVFDTDMTIEYTEAGMYGPWYGIGMDNVSSEWDIKDSYFKNWTYGAIVYVLYLDDGDMITNLKVHGNYITSPDVAEGKPFGINLPDGCGTGHEFYDNIIYDCAVGAQMTGKGWKFYNNLINTIRGAPFFTTVSLSGMILSNNTYHTSYYTSTEDCEIYNNTIVNCAGPGIYIGGNNVNAFTRNNKFINNILYNNNAAQGYQLQIRDYTGVGNQVYKNNLIYKSGTSDIVYYGIDAANDYPHTITEFNAEHLVEGDTILNNIGVDPIFTDALNNDFTLVTGSPAIDAGIDVDISYNGSAPDLGAYETDPTIPPTTTRAFSKDASGVFMKNSTGTKFMKIE